MHSSKLPQLTHARKTPFCKRQPKAAAQAIHNTNNSKQLYCAADAVLAAFEQGLLDSTVQSQNAAVDKKIEIPITTNIPAALPPLADAVVTTFNQDSLDSTVQSQNTSVDQKTETAIENVPAAPPPLPDSFLLFSNWTTSPFTNAKLAVPLDLKIDEKHSPNKAVTNNQAPAPKATLPFFLSLLEPWKTPNSEDQSPIATVINTTGKSENFIANSAISFYVRNVIGISDDKISLTLYADTAIFAWENSKNSKTYKKHFGTYFSNLNAANSQTKRCDVVISLNELLAKIYPSTLGRKLF